MSMHVIHVQYVKTCAFMFAFYRIFYVLIAFIFILQVINK